MKYNSKNNQIKSVVLTLVFMLFIFQDILSKLIGFFYYYDEFISLSILILWTIKFLLNKERLKFDLKIFLVILLIITGLLSNIFIGMQTNIVAILSDIVSFFRVILTLYLGYKLFDKYTFDESTSILSLVSKIYIIFAFVLLIGVYLFDFQMYDNIRFGLKAYRFIALNAGTLGYTTMALLLFIVYDSRHRSMKNDYIYILLVLIINVSTTKGPQILFSIVFIFIYLTLKFVKKIKWYHYIIILIAGVVVGQYQIERYFLNENEARYILLDTSLKISSDFFPIGTGFASFGSEMSHRYYSTVYYHYGISNVWGLSIDNGDFINDNYWPKVVGQFGIIGFLIVIYITFDIYKKLNNYRSNSTILNALLISIFVTYMIGSLGSSYLTSNIGVFTFLIYSYILRGDSSSEENIN